MILLFINFYLREMHIVPSYKKRPALGCILIAREYVHMYYNREQDENCNIN